MKFWEVRFLGNTSSVVISMDADAFPVKKEIAAVEKQINKLENIKIPLEAQMEAFNQKAIEAHRRLSELKKSADKKGMADAIAKARKEMHEFADKADKASTELDLINHQLNTLNNRYQSLKFTGSPDNSMSEVGEQAKKSLEGAAQAAGKVTKEVGKTKSSFKSVGSAVENFGKRISNTFKSAFILSVLYKGLNELKQRLSAMLSTNQQFTTSLNQVKSNLAVAFQPIYQAAMPAINALMQLLVKATAYIAAFVNALFGKSLNSSISAAKEMERSIQAVNSGAKGATAAEKELTNAIKEKQKQVKALQKENKQLQREYEAEKKAVEAQTDALEKQIKSLEKEIDRIQKAEDAANKAAASQREAIQVNINLLQQQQKTLQKKHDKETKAIDKQIKGYQNEIKAIQKAQKAAEEAKKANQKFTANFDELSTLGSNDETDVYETEIEKIQEKIDTLQEEKDLKAEIYDSDREAIQEQIDLLEKSKDAIKDVDYSSITEGYEERISAIREQIDALNDSLSENPQIEQNELLIEQLQEEIDLLQEKKDAIQEASDTAGGFDSSGITKFNDELEGLNENLEKNKLFTWLSDNGDKILDFITIIVELAAIVGTVYGAFKLFSSFLTIFSSPVGAIALAVVAIAGFISAFGDAEAAVDSLERILKGFAEFLLGVFTGDIDLAVQGLKDIFGGLYDFVVVVFEAIENMFIEFLEWIVKLEEEIFGIDLSPDIEDAINKSGGYKAYGSIHERIPAPYPSGTTRQIPALAQGAVLPPNKPFYAMLGDQKNGTNLEAPASLIEEIMRGVLSEQQWNFNVTANGSLGALIRLLNLQFTRENDRETAF